MGIIKNNKKGVSLVELIAAIVIIGLASSTITTMIITSYKGQLRATQYLLAKEMAKTYDSMLARDIIKDNLSKIDDSLIKNADNPDEKYVEVTETLLEKLTKISDNNYKPIYYYLFSHNTEDHLPFKLDGHVFDSSNVKIKIYVLSKSSSFCYYKSEVTVTYNGDRQVTYNESHFK